jgi:hypothetical protein
MVLRFWPHDPGFAHCARFQCIGAVTATLLVLDSRAMLQRNPSPVIAAVGKPRLDEHSKGKQAKDVAIILVTRAVFVPSVVVPSFVFVFPF